MLAQTNLWIFKNKIKTPRKNMDVVDYSRLIFFQYGQVEEIINGFELKTHKG